MIALVWLGLALAAGGTLDERVVCADGTHTYALYLPLGYEPGREWPVLLVLDPGGRATRAAEPFFEVADAYGWVVASSHDTRSDVVGADPNGPAVAAVLGDLEGRVGMDRDAVVLAGFSGTARVAWAVATALPDVSYAVLSVGAGVTRGVRVDPVPFAVFLAAGHRDFNYGEALATERALAEVRAARRHEVFAGAHEWPPADVSRRMLAWAEVEGQRRGRRPADDALVDAALADDRAWLATLRDPWESGRAHDAVARTYDGLRDTSRERAEAERLLATPEAVARAKVEARLAKAEARYRVRLSDLTDWLSDEARTPPTPVEGGFLLGADALVVKASGEGPAADSAARSVALTRAALTYYVPADARARGDFGDAAPSLAIAAALWPDDPSVHYDLACAWAQGDRPGPALDALERAVDLGYADGAWLASDPDLASLRDDPRFPELVRRLSP